MSKTQPDHANVRAQKAPMAYRSCVVCSATLHQAGHKFLRHGVRAGPAGSLTIEQRRTALRDELRKPEWAVYCATLGGKQAVCDKLFSPFIGTISGTSEGIVKALWTMGLTTPDALNAAPDRELLAIQGVGPAKLKAIRTACANTLHPASEFVDNVVR